MFKFNWSLFNVKMGFIFMIGSILVLSFMGTSGFAYYGAGISALLAWITVILVPNLKRNQYLLGLTCYLLIGTLLIWLAFFVFPYSWASVISIGIVSFAGYMMLLKGAHAFMVAWCLVYWFLLAPLFFSSKSPMQVTVGHMVGSGLVIVLYYLSSLWPGKKAKDANHTDNSDQSSQKPVEPKVKRGFVVSYASIVSLSIVGGVAAGLHWIVSDPTIVANATLNMISPSYKQTWIAAIERIILGGLGIIGGFYLGWYFQEPIVGQIVIALCSFLALATLYVNISLVVGIIFFLVSYSWGVMHTDAAHLIANEKLIGEIIGVAIAIVAIFILQVLQKKL